MTVAAKQLIDWWRARSTWGRALLVLLLLPLVPAVLLAARFGDTGGGRVAAGTAAVLGVVVYAAAGAHATTSTPAREPAATQAAPVASASTPSTTPEASPTETIDPVAEMQEEVLRALSTLRADVITVEVRPETSQATVVTRLPWTHDTDVERAMSMCDAVIAGAAGRVEVAAASGEILASGTSTGCAGPQRLPLGNLDEFADALHADHEQVAHVTTTSSRVVVTTGWTLAWDTPLADAAALCEATAAAAGDGWSVVVEDAEGRSLATGSDTCEPRAPLPSPTPSPEPAPPPAPEPEPAPANNCHPSYTGACVPADVSDVDCAGGSGNGPAYVGRVTVVGPDVYGLDRDNDGIGCE